MNDWFADGALAEFCISRPEWIASKPRSLSHAEAASVPIGALTAWQGLFDRAKLERGERLLVHGGAGAVGVYAVQLARRHGAHVITTVSARNIDFVNGLGADEAIDHNAVPFEDVAGACDIVFDTVGGDTLKRSWSILKPGGRLVTIAADQEGTPDERNKKAFFIVEPKGAQLAEIAGLIDAGEIRPVVDAELSFDQAPTAYDGTAKRSGRGKVVVLVAGTVEFGR
jgi:NADPH:quinone reductase-like Zn-dependent oxidoreductase